MAAKKTKKKKAGGNVSVTIKNPAKKKKHKKKAKKNPKKKHHRRRNPPEPSFLDRLMSLALVGGVTIISGVGVTLAQSKIAPGKWYSLYGVPAAALLGGAALASVAPRIGAGVALGAATPWVLPVTSKVLASLAGTSSPASVAGLDMDQLGAVEMGDEFYHALNAVTVGAVEVGAVEIGDEDDDDYEDDDDGDYEDELYDDAANG